ncbi:MAG: isoaspartyl peptidase/L-asparaginase [Chloroherpetonaceae bacterium]|nr:isoaspartyl peptidase/L-asparaginase [Chloroherpetonaceae bacterium]
MDKKLYWVLLTCFGISFFWSCKKNETFEEKATTKSTVQKSMNAKPKYALAIHGGAGTITRALMTPEMEKAYRESLEKALKKGASILESGGAALDAVEAVVMLLEDDSLFNAGKGAVFTHEGKNELDAAIMNGENLAAGSVAGVRHIKNPIALARKVMEKSEHVMMVGEGAETFAWELGFEKMPESYFYTEQRWKSLQKIKAEEITSAKEKHGTVGAVALDQNGNLAAATSTGGMTNKRYGRVGDAPIIGAGTYANNQSCAISATGWGEYFIRVGVAKEIEAAIRFKGLAVDEASRLALDQVKSLGGDGGVIVIDQNGNIAMPFNSEGMYRGFIKAGEKAQTAIYKDEN